MNISEYKKMEAFESDYWWHRGRTHLLEKVLTNYLTDGKKHILEVGCGTGGVTKKLEKYGKVVGIDISLEAINFCLSKGFDNVHHTDILDFNPQKPKKFHIAIALDVLEHIQEDVLALKKIRSLLNKDGILFITVPAQKFLWSEHDEALHHKRRYHTLELTQKLKDAGFEIKMKSYFVFTAFFPIMLFRFWGNIFGKSAYPKTSYVEFPKILNDFGTKLLELESFFAIRSGLPIGTTLFVVARKK